MVPAAGRPARTVVIGFGAAVVLGTALLSLPAASAEGRDTDLVQALFSATSAVCITGLAVVDTEQHWSLFGEMVILGLIQTGGLGIMTLASLLGLLVSRRLGLRMELTAQSETKSLGLGEVRKVITGVIKLSLLFELAITAVLATRLALAYGYSPTEALYSGGFHAVSAWNNAGLSLYNDSMTRFAEDPWICLTVIVAVVAGGLGFPVWFELGRRISGRQRRWSLHTKITLAVTGLLLIAGFTAITAGEWDNRDTLGGMGWPGKLLAGAFAAVMPRSGGLNSVDIGEMNTATLLVQDVLMFIGGGSSGTAGGIKVTTFAVLAFVIVAEIRGEPSVHAMGRRLSAVVQRQALTIVLLSVALVMLTTLTLLLLTPFTLDEVLFESISAVATVGLSTGITPDLPPVAHVLMSVLMFIGRLGPVTLAAALALRDRPRKYELPEERPIVG
ncbi:TrkH family potassium uptake protein [Saccharopolyspora sp. HNM0983]|uniref:TrkH family potassium uptake protein n=1 Tax=Saccharopolyspora montiporae TaxID=2781240 RepID=A0A929BCY5_9PSEU|nr:potassium transporter TrkG [Saccharopolyspora sp. HNM0983]MBE9376485.1 TrkH family potassium uptake protein [Saccharopolyspora sp. HNM0983]